MDKKLVINKFNNLSDQELSFIECFLKNEGDFIAIQKEKGFSCSYSKRKIKDIIDKLDHAPDESKTSNYNLERSLVKDVPIKSTDSRIVSKIKEKLNNNGGEAIIPLYNGGNCYIYYNGNGKGLLSPKIPPANQLIWEAFEAAVEIVLKNGGKARKGNAQSGARLGTDKLMLDSVEGYIARKVHGVKEGEIAYGPGFVIFAILDWAEICSNERGYLAIKPSFLKEMNAK